jgi:hypothetical protein
MLVGWVNGRANPYGPRDQSMTPAVLIHVYSEAVQRPWLRVIIHIAIAARHPRTAAWAGVLAFPRPMGMIFADPAAVLAEQAFHGLPSLPGLLPRIFPSV